MSSRKTTRRRLQKFPIGDMRDRITIHTRVLTPGAFGTAGFTEAYDAGTEVWCMVRTLSSIGTMSVQGEVLLNGVNVGSNSTHVFQIRWRDWVTTENVVRWRGNAYEILSVEDPEERNQYLVLPAKLLGDESKSANT